MTERGHLPNSWADVARSPVKLGTLAVGMSKPVTLTPLSRPPAYESQKRGQSSSLCRGELLLCVEMKKPLGYVQGKQRGKSPGASPAPVWPCWFQWEELGMQLGLRLHL